MRYKDIASVALPKWSQTLANGVLFWFLGFGFVLFLCRMVIEEGTFLKIRKDLAIETTMKLGTRVPPASEAI